MSAEKRVEPMTVTRPTWTAIALLLAVIAILQLTQGCTNKERAAALGANARIRLVIDTDAGTDDLIAIALLSADTSVVLEAVTVVDGLSSVSAGVKIVHRLLSRLGHPDVPVLAGSSARLQETNRFPADWRVTTEAAPLALLPEVAALPIDVSADSYLASVLLRPGNGMRILALGPLTNIARALTRLPAAVVPRVPVIIMGGAIAAKGNLISFNDSTGLNHVAEWNVFSDPLAADIVFRSHLDVTLVPLDVTSTVPVRSCLVEALRKSKRSAAGEFVLGTLDGIKEWIDRGDYYAWDPLAAAIAVDAIRHKSQTRSIRVVRDDPRSLGRTVLDADGAALTVVADVNAQEFYDWVLLRTGVSGASSQASPCLK